MTEESENKQEVVEDFCKDQPSSEQVQSPREPLSPGTEEPISPVSPGGESEAMSPISPGGEPCSPFTEEVRRSSEAKAEETVPEKQPTRKSVQIEVEATDDNADNAAAEEPAADEKPNQLSFHQSYV